MENIKRILFVINPISGELEKEEALNTVSTFCLAANFPFAIYKTTGQEDEILLAEEIRKFNPSVVTAMGGDGTVNLCAKVIQGTDIVLGIIPMGSGNGLSKDLKIVQGDVLEALNIIKNGKVIQMDTLTANGHFFTHLSDIGFNAKIIESYTADSRRGFRTYAYYTIKEFFNYRAQRYHITTDSGMKYTTRAFMITAANSNQFGTNITINPEGKVNDGIFELVIIKQFPYRQLPRLIIQTLLKRIHFNPFTRILKAKIAVIKSKRPRTLQVDGELIGKFREITIKINPANLKVKVSQDFSYDE